MKDDLRVQFTKDSAGKMKVIEAKRGREYATHKGICGIPMPASIAKRYLWTRQNIAEKRAALKNRLNKI